MLRAPTRQVMVLWDELLRTAIGLPQAPDRAVVRLARRKLRPLRGAR